MGGGMTSIADIVDNQNRLYISGDFYGSDNAEEVYRKMYSKQPIGSGNFTEWLTSTPELYKSGSYLKWEELDTFNRILNNPSSLRSSLSSTDMDRQHLLEYQKYSNGKRMVTEMYTPINMGIPYLDKDITNHMFQWNLASILSHCNKENIRTDEAGKQYVYYSGYRVYVQDAKITNYDYQVFDLTDTTQCRKFTELTNMTQPDLLAYSGIQDRNYVMLVGIEYTVPMTYEGITPLKRIYEYAMSDDTQVEGYGNNQIVANTHKNYIYSVGNMSLGGENGGNAGGGKMSRSGRVMFSLIR